MKTVDIKHRHVCTFLERSTYVDVLLEVHLKI